MMIITKNVVPVEDMNKVQVLLNMLDGCLHDENINEPEQLELAFVYCAVWALGGLPLLLVMMEQTTEHCSVSGGEESLEMSSSPHVIRSLIIGLSQRLISLIVGRSHHSSTVSIMTAARFQ